VESLIGRSRTGCFVSPARSTDHSHHQIGSSFTFAHVTPTNRFQVGSASQSIACRPHRTRYLRKRCQRLASRLPVGRLIHLQSLFTWPVHCPAQSVLHSPAHCPIQHPVTTLYHCLIHPLSDPIPIHACRSIMETTLQKSYTSDTDINPVASFLPSDAFPGD
jgi:hypothetical protein